MSEFDLRNFDGIAFDFDGILAVSNGLHMQARKTAYAEMASHDERLGQIPDEIHDLAHMYGSHPTQINAWILAQIGIINDINDIDNPLVQELVSLKNENYTKLISGGLDAQPGAVQFVRKSAVRRPGRLAIATTAYSWEVLPYLRRHKIERYFPDNKLILHNNPKVHDQKPAPDSYLAAGDALNISAPERLLVIEDSYHGIESGKRAGATVAAVATTHSVEALEAIAGSISPDIIVVDFSQLSVVTGISKAA